VAVLSASIDSKAATAASYALYEVVTDSEAEAADAAT